MTPFKSKAVFLFSLLLLNFQCDEEANLLQNECEEFVLIDSERYTTLNSDLFNITTTEIEGDCLSIAISASGCDGSSWVLSLIDSGDVAESLPPQRFLKLVLVNNEACLAVISQNLSFNISELRIADENKVQLNIEGFSTPIMYSY